MADRTPTARTSRKGFPVDPGGGNGDEGGSGRLKNKRITTASELGLAQHLAVLDEATELPPFGFNIAGLEQRLERRLGLEITPAAINECLSPYYNLREWEERYVVTSLGSDIEDFPGEGNGNRPPRSPLKEFYLFSDEDDNDNDNVNDNDVEVEVGESDHDVQGYHDDEFQNGNAHSGESAAAVSAAGGGHGAENVGGGGARSGGGAGGGAAATARPRHPAAGSHNSFGSSRWLSDGKPDDDEENNEGGDIVVDSDAMDADSP